MILTKAQINLLKFSNHIKNNERKENIETIFSNREIYDGYLNKTLEEEFIKKKNEWIAISSNEWKLRKEKPVIANPSSNRSKWKRCSLCNTPNKNEFYIVNKYNGREINIGGRCSENVVTGEINELSKFIKSEIAGKRYVNVLVEIPELREVLFSPRKRLVNLTYELPYLLEKEYLKNTKAIARLLKGYLNSDSNKAKIKKNRLLKEFDTYKLISKKINKFEEDSVNKKWAFSKKMKLTFQRQNNSKEICSAIKRNNSTINKNLAKEIKTKKFLTNYIQKNFNNIMKTNELKISNCQDEIIFLVYKDGFSNKYYFQIQSNIFIDFFGNAIFNNQLIDTKQIMKFFIENSSNLVPDAKSAKLLIEYVQLILIESEVIHPYDIYSQFYKKLNSEHLKRFEELTNNWFVLVKESEPLLYLYRNNHNFIKFGIIMMFQSYEIQNKTISLMLSKAERISPNNLFKNIKEEIYKENIFDTRNI